MKPDLSIIIVNFNTKKLVLDCIGSLKNEGSKVTKEIIIVDNGSSEKFPTLPGIKLIQNKDNLGYAKAVNAGIKMAQGEYILILNSDTIVKGNVFEKLIEFARKTSDAGVVGPRLLNIDGSIQASASHLPSIVNAIREYWLGKKGRFELYVPHGNKPQEVEALVGAVFLITPAALKKVGGFDEKYFMYYEDLDYCKRVRRASLKVYYLPSAEIVHYHGASGKKLVKPAYQWRRLIPSSKIYHGTLKHYILTLIILIGQKWAKLYGHIQKN
jgi:GT2 family glycosyltransferase